MSIQAYYCKTPGTEPQFDRACFSLTTASLEPGLYDVTVYVRNRRTVRWEDARTVVVTVRQSQ